MSQQSLSSFIWSVADLLRGDYKQSDYGKVILPFTVLRRLDCVLEATKDAVLAEYAARKGAGVNPEPFLLRKAGQTFYNTSPMDMAKLIGDQDHIGENLFAYVQAFSASVRDIFERFDFFTQVDRLAKARLLYQVTEKFANIDLHPDKVGNAEMGHVFEELIRKFAELSNETAGEHFTPREVVRLMVNLLFIEDDDVLTKPGVVRTIYDPAAGTGGMLSVAGEHLADLNPKARLTMFGQELNDESYAICKADMLIKGQDVANIVAGNTLSDDGHPHKKFDYMLSNPPFGVEWKKIEKEVRKEHETHGFNGRFGPGLPRVSDGSLLFLMHLISKMRPAKDGGSRFGIVLNGSPLFTGGAGSGESEIRRYVLENDLLEAVVGLPTDMFYNTGISTYVWIVSNRKPEVRRGKVQLIDASAFWQKMRRSFGSKRREMGEEHIATVTKLFGGFVEAQLATVLDTDGKQVERQVVVAGGRLPGKPNGGAVKLALISRILSNEDFGYRTITVERPLRDDKGKIVLGERGKLKGKHQPDTSLRDAENVPLPEDVETYFAREVLPHAPDAWIDHEKTKVGYEIPWALLSEERLSQSPAEINAYLKALRDGALTKQLRRVRAIFIGDGEVGKTSLIRALHGEDVIEGKEAMTQGVAIKDVIHEQAGVFTRVTDYKDDDLTVHFWDFGGQVMAHATHQFFLRSKCLYVIVLAGRAERNPNEEAEYWLEHVRAFGDSAPVLIVGNKADVMPVALDLQTLKKKYPNIVDFHSISCTKAKGAHRKRFELFRDEFIARLQALGEQAERFSPAQFKALKTIEQQAAKDDFIKEAGFDEICQTNGIAMQGPGGRDSLLDIFDKLGIVMHFARLNYLADYVLNPRWLTYGVYTLMYSDEAKAAKGRLTEADLVAALKKANATIENGRAMRYPPDRCHIIADAMIAFRVAYRLGNGELVIPALLAPEQPEHDFRSEDALAFRFDFGGFLPRHVLPALIVECFQDIAKLEGSEIVWQNGVLLRPKRLEAEAFVRADYHTRTIDFLIKGGDGPLYLGMLRDSVLSTLETMPQLPYEEKVELRPDMRTDATEPSGNASVWMSYGSILGAQKRKRETIDGPDGKEYVLDRVLAAAPVKPELRPADVFLSYSSEDGAQIERLDSELDIKRFSVWYDRGLIAGQPYRDVLQARIEMVKAVVVLWTENSIGSKWVRAEADLADKYGKLICLRDPNLDPGRIPMPFASNDHIIPVGDMPGLIAALALKCAKPRI